ncbi:histidine kinase [Flammeovirgaceae bacterium SG7u.111]|nr:histidine kinase [Flammeovirgaceae bacterium SG7u.132]WPO35845.1 histidine kinase [Flammeovirgaceae bacterium SG7u.111]
MKELKINQVLDYLSKNRIALHITFWVLFATYSVLLVGSVYESYDEALAATVAEFLINIPLVYFGLYILIDRYLFVGKYMPFIVGFLALVILGGVINRAVYHYILIPNYFPYRGSELLLNYYLIAKNVAGINSIMFFFISVKSLKKWYTDNDTHKTLEKEKLEAELKFLKSQIHPHFLFNTLNNLYSLSLQKSDKTPEIVLKLSELMSYMLYDANTTKVTIKKEINYLKNYIDLERIRYGNRLEVMVDIKGDVSGNMIAPMLLLPFIENSFKHGASGELETAWLMLDVEVKDGVLKAKVENNKSTAVKDSIESGYRNGIGLANVRRRLELLYEGGYDLKIFNEEESYLVVLKLELDKHKFAGEIPEKMQENLQLGSLVL